MVLCNAAPGHAEGQATSRRCHDSSVDTDHFPLPIQQRPTAVSWVDGCVALDHIINHAPATAPQAPPKGRYNAAGHGGGKTEWVADCDSQLPDPQRVGVTERRVRHLCTTHAGDLVVVCGCVL